jgi:hypothetical protein
VFTPRAGPDAARELVALVAQQGTPRTRLVLARYRVATAASPGPVSALKAGVRRGRLTVRWAPACAASFYAVTIGSGKQAQHLVVKATRASVGIGKRRHLKVSVAAVGYALRAGRAAHLTTS